MFLALMGACATTGGARSDSPAIASTARDEPGTGEPIATAPSDGTPAGKPAAASPEPRQSADRSIVIGSRVTVRSDVLGEDRELLVYSPRPPGTADSVYPVVYLLDGDAHFHHATGLLDFLTGMGLVPPMIVVGVPNTERTRDYTPTAIEQFEGSGGADDFLRFFETELFPYVEANYPTAPYRVLIGHSFGGLLAVHALNTRPALFDAYVSISPSLWWGDRLMMKQTAALLAANPGLAETLYLTVGKEGGDMEKSNRSYAAMLKAKAPKTLRWKFEELPAEDHGTIVHRAIYRGLEHVFAGWRPPQDVNTLEALEAHYQGLTRRFGFVVKVPERSVNLFGYRLLGTGKVEEAIAVFRRNAELYPESANVHDSLGEALEAHGEVQEALASYERAVATAVRQGDPSVAVFRERLEQARARAAAAK